MSAQVMQRGRPVAAFEGPRLSASATEDYLRRLIAGYTAYYGTYDIDKFLVVAERVMSRRHVTLDERGRSHLRRAFARRWSAEG